MPPRKANRPAAVVAPASASAPAAAPTWVKPVILALAALLLLGWFSTEAGDSDAWWHLKTGEYLWQQHKLPVPDPFAWTTYLGKPAYPGEEQVRDFNLTHSWLSQLILYLAYKAGGWPGLILFRALLLTGLCAAAGLVAWHRTGGFYRSLGAALLAGAIATRFASDRPFLFGFLFLAATIVILEYRRWLWLLPPLFVVWANAHGGYFLGWAPLGVYCAEALIRREPRAEQQRLWLASGLAIVASGLNPNGFRAVWVLIAYRSSPMQTAIAEWGRWAFWQEWRGVVLVAAAVVLLLAYRRVRPADWMLFALFAAAAVSAVRNVMLIGFIAPIVLATYLPWKRMVPRAAEYGAVVLLMGAIVAGVARGSTFQLRPATWKYPVGAADFLLNHRISGRMFNTYSLGGYLLWRLWPQQKVFIDGRALNESLYPGYRQIEGYADAPGGKTVEQLLAQYQIDIILMDGFDTSGGPHLLVAALSDPSQKEWKLVYQDAQAVVFMRNPPPGVPVLNSLEALNSLESQCANYLEHDPEHAGCAQGLANLFTRIGDPVRARRWSP